MDASIFAIVIISILGIGFTLVGFFMIKNYRKIRNDGRKTRSKVVDILEEGSTDGTTYRLVVEFTTIRGKLVTQKLDYSSGFKPKKTPPYPFDIYYLEENDKIKILPANSTFLFVISYIFLLVGILCLGVLVSEFTGYSNIF